MGQRGSGLAAAARAAGAAGESSRETTDEQVRRVLVHASGFRQSPYADIKPQGVDAADTRRQAARAQQEEDDAQVGSDAERRPAPSKLWHSSPGSSGW
jgi:error-prone DNA polymerase